MSKLSTIIIALIVSSTFLFAQIPEKNIENFFMQVLKEKNIIDVKVHKNLDLEYPKDFKAYFITLKYSVQNREVELKDVVFSDGKSISKDFTMIDDKTSLKENLLKNWNQYTK
ncbi:MAG: hypothetical protein ACK5LP_08165 [Campylobacteraceae bacterium]